MVYRQLSKKQRIEIDYVKQTLITAFTTDSFMMFKIFLMQWLLPSETIDVFLAELWRLALLVGEVLPENG